MMKILNKTIRIVQLKVLHSFHLRGMDRFMQKYFNNGKKLTGVEIGVCNGLHADAMLHHHLIKKLYLIDSYRYYDEISNVYDFRNCEIEARKLLKPFNNKIEFIKDFSENAVNTIPDNLDFVYIDGNHKYDFVKKDLELYYPKVKAGGIFGGHDFTISCLDVFNAVLDFAKSNNLKIQGNQEDWWIVK